MIKYNAEIQNIKDELIYRIDNMTESKDVDDLSFELVEAVDLLREVYEMILEDKFNDEDKIRNIPKKH